MPFRIRVHTTAQNKVFDYAPSDPIKIMATEHDCVKVVAEHMRAGFIPALDRPQDPSTKAAPGSVSTTRIVIPVSSVHYFEIIEEKVEPR